MAKEKNEKMRLLFVMYDRESFSGGPAVNLSRLLPELVLRGHDVYLICMYHGAHPNADIVESKGVTCCYREISLISAEVVPWILDVIIRVIPDVFIPDISTQGLLAGRWARNLGIPFVNTMRGNDDLNWGKALFFSRAGKWQSDAIVFVSDYLKNAYNTKYSTEIVQRVIPSGVQGTSLRAIHQVDRVGFVYSGRFTNRIKNVHDVLSLFIRLAEAFPNTYFGMIGHGEESQSLEERIKSASLCDRITLQPVLKGDEYKKYLASHQCVVLMSDSEGTPGAVMDAMSCGLIPLVSPIPGIEPLVLNGIVGFVAKDKSDDIFEKASILIQNEEIRRKFSQSAVEHISQSYSLKYCGDQWEYLLSRLVQAVDKKTMPIIPSYIRLPRNNELLLEHKTKPSILNKFLSKLSSLVKKYG